MDRSGHENRGGTRRVMMGGVISAVVLGLGVLAWVLVPGYDLHQSTEDATGPRFGQDQGTSTVGRSTTPPDASAAAPDPIAVGRNQAISATASNEVELSSQQRDAIRDWAASHPERRVDSVAFTVAIGVAVPQQAQLHDVSPELDAALPAYRGQQYLLLRDRLVVVERGTRRVVAIVPTAA